MQCSNKAIKKKMVSQRMITAIGLVVLGAGLIALPPTLFKLAMGVLIILASEELLRIQQQMRIASTIVPCSGQFSMQSQRVQYGLWMSMGGGYVWASVGIGANLSIVFVLIILLLMSDAQKKNIIWQRVAISISVVCLCQALYGITQLHEENIELLCTIVGLVAISDIIGYYAGGLYGKKRIFPLLSPKKTEYGTLAMIFLPGLIWVGLLGYPQDSLGFLGSCTGLFALLGDLWMSQLKRIAGMKDSGQILPGHGGLLDRIDSHILCFFILTGIL